MNDNVLIERGDSPHGRIQPTLLPHAYAAAEDSAAVLYQFRASGEVMSGSPP